VRDTSENGMAVVGAIKAGELLKEGALQAEASAQKRQLGRSIVLIQQRRQLVAYEPAAAPPSLDVTPRPSRLPSISIRDPDH
jgi:hypothetical protein